MADPPVRIRVGLAKPLGMVRERLGEVSPGLLGDCAEAAFMRATVAPTVPVEREAREAGACKSDVRLLVEVGMLGRLMVAGGASWLLVVLTRLAGAEGGISRVPGFT